MVPLLIFVLRENSILFISSKCNNDASRSFIVVLLIVNNFVNKL